MAARRGRHDDDAKLADATFAANLFARGDVGGGGVSFSGGFVRPQSLPDQRLRNQQAQPNPTTRTRPPRHPGRADLVAAAVGKRDSRRRRRHYSWLRWFISLPWETKRASPMLSVRLLSGG